MSRKAGVLAVVAVLAVPLAVAAVAYACGSLATLKLDRATAVAGNDVTARGGNFNTSPRASTIQLRFNGRNGRVLWEGRPLASGRFTATFDAPSARAGYYVIVATQTGPDGRPAAGTPGRAPLRIRRAASSRASSGAAPVVPVAAAPGGTGPAPPAVAPATVAAIALALAGMLGGAVGMGALARRRRRGLDAVRTH
jgi:hypothetical protein